MSGPMKSSSEGSRVISGPLFGFQEYSGKWNFHISDVPTFQSESVRYPTDSGQPAGKSKVS